VAEFDIPSEGNWTITVTVDDDPDCTDEDPGSIRSVVVAVAAANWKPCDTDGSGALDITDVIAYLNWFFVGNLPDPGCIGALDCDSSGGLDVTDAIVNLNHQFVTGEPPPSFPFECKKYSQAADGTGDPCEASEGCSP